MSKRKRSAAWTYFDRESGTESICTLCGESVKTSGNTSNQLKHLKIRHDKEYSLVQDEQEKTKIQKKEKLPVKQSNVTTIEMALERSQPYGKESAHRKLIDKALIKMLAVDCQPASIVEDRGFLDLLQVVDPKY